MPEITDPDEAMIRPLAARYAARFRMVDRDDIAQEMRLWWLTHQKSVNRYIEQSEERKLVKALQRAAQRFCEKEKAGAAGYSPADVFYYDSGMVRDLLPMVWSADLVAQDQRPDEGNGPRRTKPANEGNNLLAMVADVARALQHSDNQTVALLWLHFGPCKFTNEELAQPAYLNTTVAGAKMRVHRAVQSVVDQLGGESPYESGGPGRRRSMSNARAQAVTGEQYE